MPIGRNGAAPGGYFDLVPLVPMIAGAALSLRPGKDAPSPQSGPSGLRDS